MDIAVAARRVRQFAAEAGGPAAVKSNTLLSSAIAWQLLIIGEAAKRVSQTVRDEYPGVPWQEMARLRDRIAHGYDSIDWDLVWNVVHNELPAATVQIERILSAGGLSIPRN
ncbi:MAG: HepT-like ribonuclease domain-containing protein [Rhodospirillales bacterium]